MARQDSLLTRQCGRAAVRRQDSERRRDSAVAVVPAALAALLMLLPATAGCHRALMSGGPDGGGPIGVDASADVTSDAGPADVARDATGDVVVTGDGDGGTGIPCGAGLTCYGTDLCVTLNLCGGPLRCDALPDGGRCPDGSTLNAS